MKSKQLEDPWIQELVRNMDEARTLRRTFELRDGIFYKLNGLRGMTTL